MPKKLPPADPQNCGTCRCFVADPGAEVGCCHRYPPVPVVIADTLSFTYPVVARDDVCGEWARRLQS